MTTVHISLGDRSYDIRIDKGLLDQAEEYADWISGRRVLVITNEVVAPLYLDRVKRALGDREYHEFILQDGEQEKNLDNFSRILDFMLAIPCDRATTIVALGGGVVGDLAGFVSASFQRGIPFIQIPTTLLSQVDSSVGGKTGVNHPLGKNMIGAFHQPKRVLIDIDTLGTLPPREFSAGMAEVIKYGLIHDLQFFEWLEANVEQVMSRQDDALKYVIERSCQNKRDIVEQDERESGVRALLNLGHTFGHAIETATDYTTWLHGEGVAIGVMMAADLSRRHGWLSLQDCDRIEALLRQVALPVEPFSNVTPAQMRTLMQGDKKVLDGRLRLILLKAIGEAEIVDHDVPDLLAATLEKYALG